MLEITVKPSTVNAAIFMDHFSIEQHSSLAHRERCKIDLNNHINHSSHPPFLSKTHIIRTSFSLPNPSTAQTVKYCIQTFSLQSRGKIVSLLPRVKNCPLYGVGSAPSLYYISAGYVVLHNSIK